MNDISTLEEIIIRTGAIAMALTAVFTFVIFVVRLAILRPLDQKLSDQSREIKAEIDSRLTKMENDHNEKFGRVEYELKANGGGSLRDDLRATRKDVNRVADQLTRHTDSFTAWAKTARHDLAAKDIDIPDPDEYRMDKK